MGRRDLRRRDRQLTDDEGGFILPESLLLLLLELGLQCQLAGFNLYTRALGPSRSIQGKSVEELKKSSKLKEWSGRRGSNSQLSTWEADPGALYLQHLQKCLGKTHVHNVHAVP